MAQSQYGTIYVIPSEDEWYKAPYFKPNGNGYTRFANGTSTVPIRGVQSNYNRAIGQLWNVDNGTPDQNGTFNMMGNVWEWNETQISYPYRVARGASYFDSFDYYLSSSYRYNEVPSHEYFDFGFRVASVPEPCTLALLTLGGLAVVRRRKSLPV